MELSLSLLREREATRALTIEMGQMRHLVNLLTRELGRLRDNHTRFIMRQAYSCPEEGGISGCKAGGVPGVSGPY